MKQFKYAATGKVLCELNRVEVNGQRFYEGPDGGKLPSVTTLLSHFKKQQIYKWRQRVGEEEANRISGFASRRGTKFHSLMESYLLNEDPKEFLKDVMPNEQAAFNDMAQVLEKVDNIHHVEAMLYSRTVGLAGQTDLIAEFDGVPSVIDFKTSMKLKQEHWIEDYFLQTTAYSLMYEDMTGIKCPRIVVLISVDHERPQVFVKERRDYVPILAEKIKHFRAANRCGSL